MFCRARVARTCTVPKRRRLRYSRFVFGFVRSLVLCRTPRRSDLISLALPASSSRSLRDALPGVGRSRRAADAASPPSPAAAAARRRRRRRRLQLPEEAPARAAARDVRARDDRRARGRRHPGRRHQRAVSSLESPLLSSPSQRRPRLAHRELLLLAPVADAAAADAAAAAAAARGEARAPSQVAVYRADAAREGRQVAAALRARQRRDPARRPFPGAVVQAVVPSQRRDRGGHRRRARAAPSARARGRVVHADDRPRAGRARTRRDADAD